MCDEHRTVVNIFEKFSVYQYHYQYQYHSITVSVYVNEAPYQKIIHEVCTYFVYTQHGRVSIKLKQFKSCCVQVPDISPLDKTPLDKSPSDINPLDISPPLKKVLKIHTIL